MKENYLERFKDRDMAKADEQFTSEVRSVQRWAKKAIPELLKMREAFGAGTFEKEGPIFLYVSSVFELDRDQEDQAFARAALVSSLRNSLHSQENSMRSCVSLSYHSNPDIARNFTFTVIDAVTGPGEVPYSLIAVTCLAFYKMTDDDLAVRKAATGLMHWISTRFYRTQQIVLYHFVTSKLSELYFAQMQKVARCFAEVHGDILVELIQEAISRASLLQGTELSRVTFLLATLLTQLHLQTLDHNSRDQVLCSLLLFSKQLSDRQRSLLRDLWIALAGSQENAQLITQHLFDLLLERVSPCFTHLFHCNTLLTSL